MCEPVGKVFSTCLVIPPLVNIVQQPTWPFNPAHPYHINPGFRHFTA